LHCQEGGGTHFPYTNNPSTVSSFLLLPFRKPSRLGPRNPRQLLARGAPTSFLECGRYTVKITWLQASLQHLWQRLIQWLLEAAAVLVVLMKLMIAPLALEEAPATSVDAFALPQLVSSAHVGDEESTAPWAGAAADSLNSDPLNTHAEELAMQDCMSGVAVRRVWSEREMVRSFDGRHSPGTPDGMFENWDGTLICVQVVRVPLLPELCTDDMHVALAQTIVTKVVKSQHWLRASHVNPSDFIIYCWLPFAIPREVAVQADDLMSKVRLLDPRFSLRLRIPASPGSLFPALFACNYDANRQRSRGYSWSDVTTHVDTEEDCSSADDDDDGCEWDITWSWQSPWDGQQDDTTAAVAGDSHVEEDEAAAINGSALPCEAEVDVDWDIAWGPLEMATLNSGAHSGAGKLPTLVHACSSRKDSGGG